MSKFYYLHIWAAAAYIDIKINPAKFALEFDSWPADDLFTAWPIYVTSEQLRWELTFANRFDKLSFSILDSIGPGANFKRNYPETLLPSRFWKIDFSGIPGRDDFGLATEGQYLVVSEKALSFLRDHKVTHAEADLIDEDIEAYFLSGRQYFWMPDSMRAYFLEKLSKK